MCVCLCAGADDLSDDYTGDGGTVAFYEGIGGTVQLMNGHSNVGLRSRRVDIKIGPENAWVRCNCELHNECGMTNAVLGFPELGPKDSEMRNGSYFHVL